jgi:hypothetical protein
MSPVGKILVFLNLIISFAVGGFAVMNYIARTHWATRYERLSKSYAVLEGTNATYQARLEKLEGERKQLNQTLVEAGKTDLGLKPAATKEDAEKQAAQAATLALGLLRERTKAMQKLENDLVTRTKELEDERREIGKYKTAATTAQADVARRQEDVAKLREHLKIETDRNSDLVRGVNEMRDRAVAAEIQSRSLKDINSKLEDQLQNTARDLARIKTSNGRPASGLAQGLNPPPEQVEGLVKKVDGKYIGLTIGSDAGLQKGHTMDVFGLGSNAGYRGRIRIVDVTPKEAVGEVMGKLSSPIKVNDTVASSILGKR